MGRHSVVDVAPLLTADGLTVRFGAVLALDAVSLAVGAGEMVAVTGPSGAGKSTLLNALAGVQAPESGELSVGGVRLAGRDAAVAAGVVLIPQGNALVAVLSAIENVAIPLLAVPVPGRGSSRERLVDGRSRSTTARADALAAMTAVGLEDALDQLVDELSGGQQQRVAVARGLAERGVVLLADEPTSELDSTNRGVVMALLRAEAHRGAAVVVATHDPDAAEQCDAELRLDSGIAHWVRDDR